MDFDVQTLYLPVGLLLLALAIYVVRALAAPAAQLPATVKARPGGIVKGPLAKGRFTAAEVAKHDKESDVWVIIRDKVYDVTDYVEEHPGGLSLLNHAGGDSTAGFEGPQHPSRVKTMLVEHYIGDLVASGGPAKGPSAQGRFTAAEVAKHDTEDDAWLIVRQKVYDVTAWIDDHPGGLTILKHLGRDATKAFDGPQHPTKAKDVLAKFCIGDLV